jgi:hypothetical protein
MHLHPEYIHSELSSNINQEKKGEGQNINQEKWKELQPAI